MASSKGDAKAAGDSKPKKIIDVAQPGKTAPPTTSRPIIITNRPILKRDPMVDPNATKTEDKPATPVSRVAKSIKITSFDQPDQSTGEKPSGEAATPGDDRPAGDTPEGSSEPIMPLTGKSTLKIIKPIVHDDNDDKPSTATKDSKPAAEPTADKKSSPEPVKLVVKDADAVEASEPMTKAEKPVGDNATELPAHHVSKEVALEVGLEAVEGAEQDKPISAPSGDIAVTSDLIDEAPEEVPEDAAPEPVSSDITADAKADSAPEAPAATDEKPVDNGPSDDDSAAEATPTAADEPKPEESAPEAVTPDVSTEETSDILPSEATPEVSDGIAETDEQLAPNAAIEQAKHKQEEAEAALLAERERIIASKQYYLPIKSTKSKHGTGVAIVVLILVIILAAVWVDVVLDAGILHIPGVHALTHFFH